MTSGQGYAPPPGQQTALLPYKPLVSSSSQVLFDTDSGFFFQAFVMLLLLSVSGQDSINPLISARGWLPDLNSLGALSSQPPLPRHRGSLRASQFLK